MSEDLRRQSTLRSVRLLVDVSKTHLQHERSGRIATASGVLRNPLAHRYVRSYREGCFSLLLVPVQVEECFAESSRHGLYLICTLED